MGLNVLRAPFGSAKSTMTGWIPTGGAGQYASLDADRWYNIIIRVNGSINSLFVDEVEVLTINKNTIGGQLQLFFQSQSTIRVRNFSCKTQAPKCFVVMQFSADYNDLYSHVIKPTCEKYGYEVIRADEFWNSALIINDITTSINESSLIIADITPDNSNVFYELGYAHGIGKTTILMANRTRTVLPFDVRGNRTLF